MCSFALFPCTPSWHIRYVVTSLAHPLLKGELSNVIKLTCCLWSKYGVRQRDSRLLSHQGSEHREVFRRGFKFETEAGGWACTAGWGYAVAANMSEITAADDVRSTMCKSCSHNSLVIGCIFLFIIVKVLNFSIFQIVIVCPSVCLFVCLCVCPHRTLVFFSTTTCWIETKFSP